MKKYFVIGNPINHSLSPKLHNYWLKENNINAIYDKIKLEENEIENFIFKVKNQEINGCNVTVPFKKTVIPFLDKLSLEAEQAQSVNTICFNNGDLVGHNTDISGFQKAINSLNYEIKDKKILSDLCESIIGAIYIDSGYEYAKNFILKKWKKDISLSDKTILDSKTDLQEYSLKKYKKLPTYKFSSATGPRHKPLFKISVSILGSKTFLGKGNSKQEAEQDAAKNLLSNIRKK